MGRSEHPSVEELRALLLFAETGSVSAAADRLGVKQPSASRLLDQFRIGEPLVQTIGNKVELTEKGRAAIPVIRDLLHRYEDLKAYIGGKRESANVLRVATGSSASQYYLARAIASLRKQLPEWDVETRVTRGENRIVGVADGTFDLAIVSHDRLQIELTARFIGCDETDLLITELAQQRLCVVVRKDSSEGHDLEAVLASHQVPLKMLCQWNLIGLDRGSGVRRQIEQRFASSSQRPHFMGEAGGWLAVKEYAKQGLGVGLVPVALLAPEDSDILVVRVLSSDITIRYSMVHRQDAMGNNALTSMEAALRAAGSNELLWTSSR